jgi:DNA-directed RNA polymerase specialized sigma24 family protein
VAVSLVHGLDYTEAEVGALLGLKPGTVHQHAERGLCKLRAILGVEGDE